MKIANCIWILAPIHRAVDDKTARDLLGDAFKTQLLMDGKYVSPRSFYFPFSTLHSYDGSTVTFIATKADDVAASEIVRALSLEDEPDLMVLEERINVLTTDRKTAKRAKESAASEIKTLTRQLDRHKSVRSELEDHLRCLKSGKTFTPRLTARRKRQHGDNPKKRKSMGTGGRGNAKRRRSSPSDSDESSEEASGSGTNHNSFVAGGDSEDVDSDQESSDDEGGNKKKSTKSHSRRSTLSSESYDSSEESDELDSDKSENRKSKSKYCGKSKKSKKRSRDDSGDEENADSDAESMDEDEDPETERSLKAKISAEKAGIEQIRSRIADLKEERAEASSNLAKAKKRLSSVQKEKNAFCALKRAEVRALAILCLRPISFSAVLS
jgi:hypothetical protein